LALAALLQRTLPESGNGVEGASGAIDEEACMAAHACTAGRRDCRRSKTDANVVVRCVPVQLAAPPSTDRHGARPTWQKQPPLPSRDNERLVTRAIAGRARAGRAATARKQAREQLISGV